MKKALTTLLTLILFGILGGCHETTTTTTTTLSYGIKYFEVSKTTVLGKVTFGSDDFISQMELGETCVAALSSKGILLTWGNNERGQLGDGTTTNKLTARDVTAQISLHSGESLSSVTMGDKFSLVLTSEGRVFSWGWNYLGRLGDGTTVSRTEPLEITEHFNLHSEETIQFIASGEVYSGAITSEGRVLTWGVNGVGQLGDGTIDPKSSPTDVTGQFHLADGELISDLFLGHIHSAALTTQNRVFIWGSNSYGQLGNGSTYISIVPVDITDQFDLEAGESIESLCLGIQHTLALTSSGRVFSWGRNASGQLGNGTTANELTPQEITSQFDLEENETIVSLSSGEVSSAALTSSQRVFVWGDNRNGQLGDGTTADHNIPTDITSKFSLSPTETIQTIILQETFSILLTSRGRIYCWGTNGEGQLGDGTTYSRFNPIEITKMNQTQTLIQSDTLFSNESLVPFQPVREGFVFSGWYLDSGLTNPYTESLVISQNLQLFGEWKPET